MGYLTAFKIGSSALQAQRTRLDVISNNIANSETTRTDSGGPYQRQDVVFSTNNNASSFSQLMVPSSESENASDLNGVKVSQ